VLAIITIMALALVPALIRQYDRLAREAEDKALKELGDGVQRYVRRTRTIPTCTDYPTCTNLAAEMGWTTNQVVVNGRHLARRFLIHPSLGIGGGGLPYLQSYLGVANPPSNGRIMIVSSISTPLPAGLTDGSGLSTNSFNAIWNAPDNTVPADAALWGGWTAANGYDLRVRRINLELLFVPLTLHYDTANQGRYSIDNSTPTTLPSGSSNYFAYYLVDTVLGLYQHGTSTPPQDKEVLREACSFNYELDRWRGIYLGPNMGHADGLAAQAAVNLFMGAPTNSGAKAGTTQNIVSNAMALYMTAYINWRAAGYPKSGSTMTAVNNAQKDLATDTANLLFKPAP